jgi:regulator of nonsense transcripts 2
MPSASQFSRNKILQSADVLNEDHTIPSTLALSGASGMNFTFIKRGRKGRAESKRLIVPIETNLVKVATTQDTEAALERDMLKARVLRYEAESAEMSYSGDVYMSQEQVPEVRNRSLRNIDIDKQFGRSRTFSGRGMARGRGSSGGRGLKRF